MGWFMAEFGPELEINIVTMYPGSNKDGISCLAPCCAQCDNVLLCCTPAQDAPSFSSQADEGPLHSRSLPDSSPLTPLALATCAKQFSP